MIGTSMISFAQTLDFDYLFDAALYFFTNILFYITVFFSHSCFILKIQTIRFNAIEKQSLLNRKSHQIL